MRTTALAKKDALISDLIAVRKGVLDAASALAPKAQDVVFLGQWSVKDLLAHLAGWDDTNLEAVQQIRAGQLPAFYSYYDRGWKTYNARLVADYRRDRVDESLSVVEASHRNLIEFLKTVPAEEFHNDRGLRFRGYKVTIARLLQAEIDDERQHHAQVKEFIAESA